MSNATNLDTEGFVEVCLLADLEENRPAQFQLGGDYIVVVHTEGEVFALEDACSHADVALSDGDVEDCHLECWMHGSRFDLRTGIPDAPPAVAPVPTYTVRLVDDERGTAVLINPTATRSSRS